MSSTGGKGQFVDNQADPARARPRLRCLGAAAASVPPVAGTPLVPRARARGSAVIPRALK